MNPDHNKRKYDGKFTWPKLAVIVPLIIAALGIAGGVATVALGLSIICLLMGQVGSISHLKEETQSDAKKPADKK